MRASDASSCAAQSQSQPARLSLVTHDEWTRASSGAPVATSPCVSTSTGRCVERFWNQCAANPPCAVSRLVAPVASSDPKLRRAGWPQSGGFCISRPSWVVLSLAHRSKIGDEPVELYLGETRMRGHARVAEGQGVADVGSDLLDRPVLDDAAGDVEIRADAAAFAVDRVAGNTFAAEDGEADPGRRPLGLPRRHGVRERALEGHALDRRELVGPGVVRVLLS